MTKTMFTTTATLKERVGVYGLSVAVGEAGEEFGVELLHESPSETLWKITRGRMAGCVINGNLLSFDLPATQSEVQR